MDHDSISLSQVRTTVFFWLRFFRYLHVILQRKCLKIHCRGADWVNKTIKKNRNWQPSVISLYTEIHEDDNELTAIILETKYDPRA